MSTITFEFCDTAVAHRDLEEFTYSRKKSEEVILQPKLSIQKDSRSHRHQHTQGSHQKGESRTKITNHTSHKDKDASDGNDKMMYIQVSSPIDRRPSLAALGGDFQGTLRVQVQGDYGGNYDSIQDEEERNLRRESVVTNALDADKMTKTRTIGTKVKRKHVPVDESVWQKEGNIKSCDRRFC